MRPHNLHSLHNNMAGHSQPAGGKSFVINRAPVLQCKSWLPVVPIIMQCNGQGYVYSNIQMHGFVTEATSYSYKHFSMLSRGLKEIFGCFCKRKYLMLHRHLIKRSASLCSKVSHQLKILFSQQSVNSSLWVPAHAHTSHSEEEVYLH